MLLIFTDTLPGFGKGRDETMPGMGVNGRVPNGRAGLDFSPTYCVLYFRTLCAFIRVLVTGRVRAASDRGVSTFSPTGPGPVAFLTNMTHEAKKNISLVASTDPAAAGDIEFTVVKVATSSL